MRGYRFKQDAGVSPLFPPAHLDAITAAYHLAEVVHRSPSLSGQDRSTWTLASVRAAVPWLHQVSLPGVCKILRRCALRYRRGRLHVHSPDPLYDQKMAQITRARELAQQAPDRVVFLYVDEHTVNLRPEVSKGYAPVGSHEPKVPSGVSDTVRLAGALDVCTGQVIARRRRAFTVKDMYRFFYHVEQHYPDADIIYIALDNWAVHFHPYVMKNLARINSKIRLLRLPTYAPWTNPIEKFWLKLNREFAAHHAYGTKKQAFHHALDLWLDKHREESQALLHEVGLFPKDEFPYPV